MAKTGGQFGRRGNRCAGPVGQLVACCLLLVAGAVVVLVGLVVIAVADRHKQPRCAMDPRRCSVACRGLTSARPRCLRAEAAGQWRLSGCGRPGGRARLPRHRRPAQTITCSMITDVGLPYVDQTGVGRTQRHARRKHRCRESRSTRWRRPVGLCHAVVGQWFLELRFSKICRGSSLGRPSSISPGRSTETDEPLVA